MLRLWLIADVAWRLGPRPVALMLRHRLRLALGLPQRALRGQSPLPVPASPAAPAQRAMYEAGTFLPAAAPPAPGLPPGAAERIAAAVGRVPAQRDWHGPFDPEARALGMDLFAPGDVRPVWEASRFGDLLLLVQAARAHPGGGHLAQAEAWLAAWCVANPAFRGPNWACGQEAALRALALALALALLDADRHPPPASRRLLALCAQRIAATPDYAAAQDNNHALSEPAGSFACALMLGDRAAAARAASALSRAVGRLIAPDGGFAQVSAGYARLALDVLSLAEWLRRRHGAAPFPPPLAERAGALAAWLHRLVAPQDGSTPALGVEDGSAFADLGLHGPADARGSVERAARLFAQAGGDLPDDAGAAWLGLAAPAARLARPPRWRAAGSMGFAEAGATAVLRCGPLHFRPSQADLLHLTLRDGPLAVLRDGGTGAYNPPADWWWAALAGAAAHNAAVFDGAEPMPRLGRFLFAQWPRLAPLPGGAARRDAGGMRQWRSIAVAGRVWTITDTLAGPFRRVALHWRLAPAAWQPTPTGAACHLAHIVVSADAPVSLGLAPGFESRAYGTIAEVPMLVVEAAAPVSRVTTILHLA